MSRQDLRVHGAVPGVAAALGAASRTPAREPGMPRTAGAGTEKRGKHEQKNEVSFGKHENKPKEYPQQQGSSGRATFVRTWRMRQCACSYPLRSNVRLIAHQIMHISSSA